MGCLNILNQNGSGSVMVFPLASALPEGRWYWEVRFVNGDVPGIGDTVRIGVFDPIKSLDGNLGEGTESWAWCADGTKWTAGKSEPCGNAPTEKDDIFMVALDAAEGSLWFGLNGTWFEGDPASGRSPSFSALPSTVLPALSSTHGGFGTLHQFVPTDFSEFRSQPPQEFQRFAPGTEEYLPQPNLFGAKQAVSGKSAALRLLDAVKSIANTRRSADLEARGVQYRDLAKDFFDKGNLLMAEKLAMQVLVGDPFDSEAGEMAAWFPVTRGSSYQLRDASDPAANRLLDFAYIPTEKCGSGAHVALLAVHPETTVPTTAEISGARQQPSGEITDSDYAERLARIVRPDGFFQAVRDPFGSIRSFFNSNVVQNLCGGYSFSFSNPETPFSDIPRDLGAIRSRPPGVSAPEIDSDRLKDFFDFAIRMPRPYSIGKVHADFFDAWQVIDLDRAKRNKDRGRMAETYRALGIREDFTHLFDEFPHRDIVHFAMLRNGMRLRIFDADITVYLGRAVQSVCYNTEDLIELCWAEPDPACREIGLGQTLCLAIPTTKWRALPDGTKQRIIQSRKLERFFRNIFIPCWVDDYRRWRKALSPYLIDEIDDALRKRMMVGVRDEARAFLEVHPEVAESWPDLVAML